MSAIAFFPCCSTGSDTVVGELAKELHLRLYTDMNLFHDTSLQFDLDKEKLNHLMYGKTSVFNQFTLEKEMAVNSFKIVLAEKLQEDQSYLFYGMHTALIPQNIGEVLRVLIVDQKKQRIDHEMAAGLSKAEAKKKIKRHDVSAFAWSDFLFGKEPYEASMYDLVLPVEGRRPKALIEEIIRFYHKTAILRTSESQQAVKDMALAAAVERKLLAKGHKLPVKAENGLITLTIATSAFSFHNLSKEVTELVQQVDGVKDVVIVRSKTHEDSVYRQQKFELPSKVLFVDDEREFVQTVSQRLISRDVGTYGVYNGEEALELINQDRPDVMVLDLKMPGLHGTEVLRRTKEIAPQVEVIILTGHGTVKDEQECMALGAFAYLNKPVDIEQLSATIKAANAKVLANVAN
jgi:two-component system response regulator CpxR